MYPEIEAAIEGLKPGRWRMAIAQRFADIVDRFIVEVLQVLDLQVSRFPVPRRKNAVAAAYVQAAEMMWLGFDGRDQLPIGPGDVLSPAWLYGRLCRKAGYAKEVNCE